MSQDSETVVNSNRLLLCAAITAMNASYRHCLLKCRQLANAEGLYTNRLMSDISQSIADQLLYTSAIEMVSYIFTILSTSLFVSHQLCAVTLICCLIYCLMECNCLLLTNNVIINRMNEFIDW